MALSMLNSMNGTKSYGYPVNRKIGVSSDNSGSTITACSSPEKDRTCDKNGSIKRVTTMKSEENQGCCHDGDAFCNALKAMVTRLMFLLHTMIVTWRATVEHGVSLWYIAIAYSLFLVETIAVLIVRRGKEWKW